jgi:hypothetical protein
LNLATDDCGNVDSADFIVTIKGQTSRYLTVEAVSVYPNNLLTATYEWLYADARIEFSLRNQLTYSGIYASTSQAPRVQLTIPSEYAINDLFNDEDHCYLNFKGTCVLSSSTLIFYPTETLKTT